ncbi:membrane hypothetical protein [Hyphomicrobiales bacterium]|nr:membrane hypothetical protein [Hyphomicrobiales bacterium]CAH1697063.1 membrane hypothetical protein [Hyphomicrobiales bacterium]CAI0345001.1 membrane hypothetical protein [Hyphomicrobiales bacterium]
MICQGRPTRLWSATQPAGPDHAHRNALSLPREGALARAASTGRVARRRIFPRRPAVRHRERPIRLRSGRARASAQDQISDADAERVAGTAAQPLRRYQRRPRHPRGRPGGSARADRQGGRPGCHHPLLRELHAGRAARRAETAHGSPGIPLHRFTLGLRLDHQPRQRRRSRRADRPAGRSVALPWQPYGERPRPMGRERSRRPRSRWPERIAAACAQAHRALRGDQCRPGDRRPRHADPEGADAGLRPCRLRHLLPHHRRREPARGRHAETVGSACRTRHRLSRPANEKGPLRALFYDRQADGGASLRGVVRLGAESVHDLARRTAAARALGRRFRSLLGGRRGCNRLGHWCLDRLRRRNAHGIGQEGRQRGGDIVACISLDFALATGATLALRTLAPLRALETALFALHLLGSGLGGTTFADGNVGARRIGTRGITAGSSLTAFGIAVEAALAAILAIEATLIVVAVVVEALAAVLAVEALAALLLALSALAIGALAAMAIIAIVAVGGAELRLLPGAGLEGLSLLVALFLALVRILDEGAVRREGMAELLGHLLLSREQNAIVMLGVLEIALGRDGIARGLGIACKLQVLLGDMLRRATDLYVRPVGFIATLQRIGRFAITVVVAVIIAAAHTPVLTWSHSRLSRASVLKATVVPSCARRYTAGCDAVSD